MAARLQLHSSLNGMSMIWNVSHHVGDNVSCTNRPTDVELVKILLLEAIRLKQPTWVHSALRVPFHVNGQMDALTAFWIRFFNADHRPQLSGELAGIISPARGGMISARDTWTIVKLNWAVRQGDPNRWANLATHPNAGSTLRAELA